VLKVHAPELGPLKAEQVHGVMGMTMDEISKVIFPGYEEKNRRKLFRMCETHEVDRLSKTGGTLFPYVRETLDMLLAAGYKMAVVSNCQKGYIDAFFTSMDMGRYFCDMEEWGRTLKPKSENIKLVMERAGTDKAIYIGDTKTDEAAAHAAGIPFVHAAYGFGSADNPAAVLTCFSGLPKIIRQFEE
ncbi:MAG: HAD family hydrolase, partial [Lachnospiraceae bacterium]